MGSPDSGGSHGVNHHLRTVAERELGGILGFEDRPLVSADFVNDTRSGMVDDRLVKVLTWYDNEYGNAVRLADLEAKVATATAGR